MAQAPRVRSRSIATAALLLAPLVGALFTGTALADPVDTMTAQFPSATGYLTAIYDGSDHYLFTGFAARSTVYRYDSAADSLTTAPGSIPGNRYATGGASNGTHVFLFGGATGSVTLSSIVRYELGTGSVSTMTQSLPAGGLSYPGVIYDGTYMWIFGGARVGGTTSYRTGIHRYDPATDTITLDVANLPAGRYGMGAVFDGDHTAYILGGWNGAHLSDIVAFDTDTATVTTLTTSLPEGISQMSAVWMDGCAILFGGHDAAGQRDEILCYRAATGVVETMSTPLPTPSYVTGASHDGARAFVFGDGYGRQIVRVRPDFPVQPSAPRDLAATAGPGAGEISLSWSAPASNGGRPLTAYHVYSGTTPGTHTFLATVGAATTSYVDTGLGTGAARYYVVTAENEVAEGDASSEASATTFDVPSAPQDFSATAGPGAGEISIAWSAPTSNGGSAITGYRVYGGPSSGSLSLLATVSAETTSFVDSGLGNGATRFYAVTAANIAGESAQSTEAGGTTYSPPSAPQSSAAVSGPGAGEVSISWSAPASNGGSAITGYQVYRGSASGSLSLLTTVGAGTTSFVDSGLGNGALRYYAVTAINVAGESVQSGEVSATTFSPPGAPQSPAAAPGPGAGEVSISWSAPASNGGSAVTGYQVYRGTASGSLSLLTTVGAGTTSFVDSGLGNGATRFYAVAATNVAGESAQSGEVSATTFSPPSAPQSPAAAPGPGAGEISISWSAPASNGGSAITGYQVYRGTSSGSLSLLTTVGAGTTSFVDSGLGNGATRFYAVAATNVAGESAQSSEVSATTFSPPSAPLNLDTAYTPPHTIHGPWVRVGWDDPASNGGSPITSFVLYRGVDGAALTPYVTLGAAANSYVDQACYVGTTCTYRVAATNVAGEGTLSNADSITGATV